MDNILRVYHIIDNQFIGEIFYNKEKYWFSDDTDKLLIDGISFILENSKNITIVESDYCNYINKHHYYLEKIGLFDFIDKAVYFYLTKNFKFKVERLYAK